MPESPIAIITGAGSGIGRATALRLASMGWRLTLVGRRAERLAETVSLIHAAAGSPNPATLTVACDLAEHAAAERIIDATVKQWGGRIDALINNAATLLVAPLSDMREDAARASFEVNVFAPLRLVQQVWPFMRQQGGGRIVNVSSMSTVDPFPGLGVYGMSKSALEGLTRAINTEGQRDGIIGFTLVLGAVETEMLRSFVAESALPRSRTKDSAEVARVVAACAAGDRDAEAGTPIVVA